MLSNFRVVSRTISCSISESPLHFLYVDWLAVSTPTVYLCPLVDHEADAVGEALALLLRVPGGVDDVSLCLNLK